MLWAPRRSAGHRKGEGKWEGGVAAVCGEAGGVALAELGALGPVSSTGDRKGEGERRERVPE